MAKPRQLEVRDEAEVTLLRKVAPERFDVVVGTIRGTLEVSKVLERNVSLMVARGTARSSIDRQASKVKAALGIAVDA